MKMTKIAERCSVVASALPNLLIHCMQRGIVPYVESSPGIGKSAIAKQIATMKDLFLIDMRLAGCDPTDLNGFPAIANGRAGYKPFEEFPVKGDELPWRIRPVYETSMGQDTLTKPGVRYKGWLLLLDELPSAPRGVQAACYKLILDRMTGNHKLHDDVWIMACGNKKTDNAIVNPLGTALQSRMTTFCLEFDYNSFMEHAIKVKMDTRMIGYLQWKPDNAYVFKAQHTDITYPCPRTWDFMQDLITPIKGKIGSEWLPMFTGTVGQGIGREFYSFCRIYDNLPDINALLANPEHIALDFTKMDIMYALSSVIQVNLNANTAAQLIKLIDRMPSVFQVLCIMDTIQRDSALGVLPEISSWVVKNSSKLVGAL